MSAGSLERGTLSYQEAAAGIAVKFPSCLLEYSRSLLRFKNYFQSMSSLFWSSEKSLAHKQVKCNWKIALFTYCEM